MRHVGIYLIFLVFLASFPGCSDDGVQNQNPGDFDEIDAQGDSDIPSSDGDGSGELPVDGDSSDGDATDGDNSDGDATDGDGETADGDLDIEQEHSEPAFAPAFSGFAASAGTAASDAYKMTFRLAPAVLSIQSENNEYRLNASVTLSPIR